jgi:hypothetical protein
VRRSNLQRARCFEALRITSIEVWLLTPVSSRKLLDNGLNIERLRCALLESCHCGNRPIAPLARHGDLSYAADVYQPHPSQSLTAMFRDKPYQGARPESAEFVFVGLDANYDAQIESSPAYPRVWEYHDDGVAFWWRQKVHHPFLLTDYRGDGQHYHRNFARTGFEPEDACRVSFVELLHIPTVGRSKLVAKDLDLAHLKWLDGIIWRGAKRNVFLSDKVIRLMLDSRRLLDSRLFFDLPEPIANHVLPTLHKIKETTIYQHLHFSNWGRRLMLEAAAIARLRTDSPHLLPCSLCAEHKDAAHPDDWLGRIGPDRELH